MDPLFSVDLSDPENPKIMGELKITGFSSYLHFYESDKLLGIGREVNPRTGAFEGIKPVSYTHLRPGREDVPERPDFSGVQWSRTPGSRNL